MCIRDSSKGGSTLLGISSIGSSGFEDKLGISSIPIPRLGIHSLIMGVNERNIDKFAKNEDQEIEEIEIENNDTTDDDNDSDEPLLTLNSRLTTNKILSDEPTFRYLENSGVIPDVDTVVLQNGNLENFRVLEIKNGVERSIQFDKEALYDNPTKLVGYYQGKICLTAFLPEVVITAVGSSHCQCWCLSTAEGSLYIIGYNGQYRSPRISVGHKIIKMINRERYLIALTERGLFYIWDIEDLKLVSKNIPILPILNNIPFKGNKVRTSRKIRRFWIDMGTQELIVEFNDPEGKYQWKRDLGCWVEYQETV